MSFPDRRMRRLRHSTPIRRLVAETSLSTADLVAPLFVREGIEAPVPVASMPGVEQHTHASLHKEVDRLVSLGVPGIMLFGIPATKDATGSQAWNPDGVMQVALRSLNDAFGSEVVIMADLCVDEYTDHGHCGIISENGGVDNDATLEIYGQIAVAQAEAGASVVAPSGMMDGQVRAIRRALDTAGFTDTAILGYSSKFASAFYGPFRDAVDVTIADGGDRRGYQQDWRNRREALEEIRLDIDEGADMVMVKPAMAYLDIVAQARDQISVPLCAYHVSGEYAMLKAAAQNGWIDFEAAAVETLTAIKRAGADFVLTYLAGEVAELLRNQS